VASAGDGYGNWAPFVWLNGEVVPAEKARVSVFDRGILLGDGVYETLRVRNGRPFRWPPHRERLRSSLEKARIALPFPLALLDQGIAGCLRANHLREARLRMTLTRGDGNPGFEMMEGARPTVVIAASPWRPLPQWKYSEGVQAVIPRIRQTGEDNLDPALKSISRIHLVLARMEAEERGAQEALLLGSGGEVREGTASNVFLAERGTLRTPSLESGVLEGITREAILELARAAGIPCREDRVTRDDLESADEIFFTNTSWGALPVTRLDGKPVGSGRPGPLSRKLGDLLAALVDRECA
jgi:branched-chain amino acid aminotransferase